MAVTVYELPEIMREGLADFSQDGGENGLSLADAPDYGAASTIPPDEMEEGWFGGFAFAAAILAKRQDVAALDALAGELDRRIRGANEETDPLALTAFGNARNLAEIYRSAVENDLAEEAADPFQSYRGFRIRRVGAERFALYAVGDSARAAIRVRVGKVPAGGCLGIVRLSDFAAARAFADCLIEWSDEEARRPNGERVAGRQDTARSD